MRVGDALDDGETEADARVIGAYACAAAVKRLSPFFDAETFVKQWRDEKSRRQIADALAKAGLT